MTVDHPVDGSAGSGFHILAVVVHDDADFDRIARVSRLTAEWVVPRGSI